jgi:hypothetical protein
MGSCKRAIHEHIEARPDLEQSYIEENSLKFVQWLDNQDTMVELWAHYENFIAENDDEFWEYCAEDYSNSFGC